LGTSTKNIAKLLKDRLEQQEKDINSKLCSLVIENSINMQCNGLYLLPNQLVTVHCKDGYYISRDPKTTCKATNQVKCLPCNCLEKNAVSKSCDDAGNCNCKPSYFGSKCESRNCQVSSWGNWDVCKDHSPDCYAMVASMSKGQHSRSRRVTQPAEGEGKCTNLKETKSCEFQKCSDQCYHYQIKCKFEGQNVCANYKTNKHPRIFCTGNVQCSEGPDDEYSCGKFKCPEHTTASMRHDNTIDALLSLPINCGGNLIGGFKFYRDAGDNRMTVRYRCCRIDNNYREMYDKNPVGEKSSIGPAHSIMNNQKIDCNEGFVNSLSFKSSGHQFKLAHNCYKYVRNAHGGTYIFREYTRTISKTIQGNDTRAFQDVEVSCPFSYFLSKFEWSIVGSTLRYSYKCYNFTHMERGGGGRFGPYGRFGHFGHFGHFGKK